MREHLSDPEYLHVLLNPLPIYGLAVGVLGLIVALISRSRAARVTPLVIVLVSALSAWPVYHCGEAAYDSVLAMADSEGGRCLDEHMRRGEQLIVVFHVVGSLAAFGLLAEAKFPRASVPLPTITLLLAAANLGVDGYIAYAGGHVRHREFRFEPAPEKRSEEHHHD